MKFNLKNRYDDEKLCENPDKGWYIHYYDNNIIKYGATLDNDDFLEDFPLLDHIYLRLAWSYLEPQEGVYDWDVIDKVIDPWVVHGKKISFRITCKETGFKEIENQVYATPKWVFDAGAKYTMFDGVASPDYGDPIFLEKLRNFHQVFAKRYANRKEIIYHEIGSYGDWGEAHCCASGRKDWPVSVLIEHMQIYLDCYKNCNLAISDDIIGSRVESGHEELMKFIVDNNIGIRDDSVCVRWFSERFGYNSLRSGEIFDKMWRKQPSILELDHYQKTIDFDDYQDGWPFLAAVQESHATYAGFHGYPRHWLPENKEMAVMLGNQLGYWYFLYQVDMPAEITKEEFEVKCYWENKGAAVAYKKYNLQFKLSGENDEEICEAPMFDNKEMMPHTITVRPQKLKFTLSNGVYKLSCRMYSDENRTIEIGMNDDYRDENGFYQINTIIIKKV